MLCLDEASFGERQNVIRAAGFAGVTESRKLCNKNALVFLAVHFADNSGAFFLQQSLRAAKHFHLRAFHITF